MQLLTSPLHLEKYWLCTILEDIEKQSLKSFCVQWFRRGIPIKKGWQTVLEILKGTEQVWSCISDHKPITLDKRKYLRLKNWKEEIILLCKIYDYISLNPLRLNGKTMTNR